MLLHEKYSTLGTVIATALTTIGTIAALAYYLSVSKFNTIYGFTFLFGGYLLLIVFIYSYFNRRLRKNV